MPALAAIVVGNSPARSNAAASTAGPSASRASNETARQPYRFHGRVTSSNRDRGWFQMRTTGNTSVRIYTNHGTYWNNCNWGLMRYGYHLDVYASRNHGSWMATRMQYWGNGPGMMGDDWDMMG